uniref:Uncharacterized protein n=1 Tax=Aegilops tauschii subsp. strangulata TaxID=200361 RepID=A0A453PXP6_AEGTS
SSPASARRPTTGLLPLQSPPEPAVVVRPRLVAGRVNVWRKRNGARRGDHQEQQRRLGRQDRQGPVRPARAPAGAGQPPVLRRQRPPPLPRLQAPPVKAGPTRGDRVTRLLCFAARTRELTSSGGRCASISRAPTHGSVVAST